MAAMETAVDLVLLDDRIQVGVLRGNVLQHPKYPGKRIFNAGINLTHLYYGQISFVEFIIERELGLLNKIYRGHSQPDRHGDQLEDVIEKPWLALGMSKATWHRKGKPMPETEPACGASPADQSNLGQAGRKASSPARPIYACRVWPVQGARHGIFFEKSFMPEHQKACRFPTKWWKRPTWMLQSSAIPSKWSPPVHQHHQQP
jgi:hypothetical protein